MSEHPAISEVNEPNRTSEFSVEPKSIACTGGCQNHRTLTAVFYAPIVLIFGGLVTLAAFPEIAEYVAPWIGEPVSQHACSSVGSASQCSNHVGLTNGCSNTACSMLACEGEDCCERFDLAETSDSTKTSEKSVLTAAQKSLSDVTTNESPADARSSENTNPTGTVSH